MRVIVAGSRGFEDYEWLKVVMDDVIRDRLDCEIVSGGARGADALGERYAIDNGYHLTRFNARWDEYGKAAGPIRNRRMAEYAKGGLLVAFWDGKSKGTGNMIRTAGEYGIEVVIAKA